MGLGNICSADLFIVELQYLAYFLQNIGFANLGEFDIPSKAGTMSNLSSWKSGSKAEE